MDKECTQLCYVLASNKIGIQHLIQAVSVIHTSEKDGPHISWEIICDHIYEVKQLKRSYQIFWQWQQQFCQDILHDKLTSSVHVTNKG